MTVYVKFSVVLVNCLSQGNLEELTEYNMVLSNKVHIDTEVVEFVRKTTRSLEL